MVFHPQVDQRSDPKSAGNQQLESGNFFHSSSPHFTVWFKLMSLIFRCFSSDCFPTKIFQYGTTPREGKSTSSFFALVLFLLYVKKKTKISPKIGYEGNRFQHQIFTKYSIQSIGVLRIPSNLILHLEIRQNLHHQRLHERKGANN